MYYLKKVSRKISIFSIIFFIFVTFTPDISANDSATIDTGFPIADMTIFRTVNTLSCHPQNPLLHEVPHYVIFNPEKDYNHPRGIKGGCWAYHNEGGTNFISEAPGKIGLKGSEDENNLRPPSPVHHYSVIEMPNPKWNPDPLFQGKCKAKTVTFEEGIGCGKYLHEEGYGFMFTLTVNDTDWMYPYTNSVQGSEVWYQDNSVGDWVLGGKNIAVVEAVGTAGLNPATGKPYTVYAGIVTDKKTRLGWTCKSGSERGNGGIPHPRPGDNIVPCLPFGYEVAWEHNILNGEIRTTYANPMIYPDIPRNRFTRNPRNMVAQGDSPAHAIKEWFDDEYLGGSDDPDHKYDDRDDDWVKCQNNGTYEKLFGKSYREYIKEFIKYRDGVAKNPEGIAGMAISLYTPDGCDYEALPVTVDQNGDYYKEDSRGFRYYVNRKPREQYELNALLNAWTFGGHLGTDPRVVGSTTPGIPTNTPILTPTHHRSDINHDGLVNVQDYNTLVTQFGLVGNNLSADINQSGKVDVQDYNMWVGDYMGH